MNARAKRALILAIAVVCLSVMLCSMAQTGGVANREGSPNLLRDLVPTRHPAQPTGQITTESDSEL